MYRQIKDICMCILLYISITCTNGLLCYSCFGYEKDALGCDTITCELSLFSDLTTACYYQVFESGYQRRGCENVTSELSHLIEGNMALYYCREDYCNGYSNVFLNDTPHRYKSRETQEPDLKPSWDSTADEYPSLARDNTHRYSVYDNFFLIIMITCIIVATIYACYLMIKVTCPEICLDCDPDIPECSLCIDCCDNNTDHNSDVSYNMANSNHNNYSDNAYSYGDTNFDGGNDFGSDGNDDGGGDCGDGDCGDGGDVAADCGGGDYGGSDCGYGGNDYGGTDYGGTDYGGTDYGGTDYGGTDYGGTDYGGTDYSCDCTD